MNSKQQLLPRFLCWLGFHDCKVVSPAQRAFTIHQEEYNTSAVGFCSRCNRAWYWDI